MRDDKLIQRVHEPDHLHVEWSVHEQPLSYERGRDEIKREFAAKFVRPFRLDQAPLVRAALLSLSDEEHILFLDMHT